MIMSQVHGKVLFPESNDRSRSISTDMMAWFFQFCQNKLWTRCQRKASCHRLLDLFVYCRFRDRRKKTRSVQFQGLYELRRLKMSPVSFSVRSFECLFTALVGFFGFGGRWSLAGRR